VGEYEGDWRQGMRWASLREGVVEVGQEGRGEIGEDDEEGSLGKKRRFLARDCLSPDKK